MNNIKDYFYKKCYVKLISQGECEWVEGYIIPSYNNDGDINAYVLLHNNPNWRGGSSNITLDDVITQYHVTHSWVIETDRGYKSWVDITSPLLFSYKKTFKHKFIG
jgi:hypothetical protein